MHSSAFEKQNYADVSKQPRKTITRFTERSNNFTTVLRLGSKWSNRL